MTHALLVLACVVQAVEGGAIEDSRCKTPEIQQLTSAIQREAARRQVPAAIIAADFYHESSMDRHARGSRGEIGYGQLLRGGAVAGHYRLFSNKQLEETDTNVYIAVEYMARFAHKCRTASQWLSMYNRPAGGCRSSRYSRGVLEDLRAARRVALLASSERSGYSSLAAGWLGTTGLTTESTASWGQIDHTWYKQADSRSASKQGTRDTLHSDTHTPTRSSSSEEELAAPFAEP